MGAGEAKTKDMFKVTARGVGASANAVVVIQSTFAR
jgi:Tfp pilus assembly protein PilX